MLLKCIIVFTTKEKSNNKIVIIDYPCLLWKVILLYRGRSVKSGPLGVSDKLCTQEACEPTSV